MSEEVLRLLDTYTLEEILELNDLTAEDVVDFLLQHGKIHLPEYLPVDL